MGQKRINLQTAEQERAFSEFETLCVLRGKDYVNELAALASASVEVSLQSAEVAGKVDAEELIAAAAERGIELDRAKLFQLREKELTESVDYWSAPSGRVRVFRYDLQKSLAKIARAVEGK